MRVWVTSGRLEPKKSNTTFDVKHPNTEQINALKEISQENLQACLIFFLISVLILVPPSARPPPFGLSGAKKSVRNAVCRRNTNRSNSRPIFAARVRGEGPACAAGEHTFFAQTLIFSAAMQWASCGSLSAGNPVIMRIAALRNITRRIKIRTAMAQAGVSAPQ